MHIRCGKYRHLQTHPEKSKCYVDIKIEFTREEYKAFCEHNKEHILSLLRPSLDRIDNNKNYSLNNIQFIELDQNIRKDKTVFDDFFGICSMCKKTKEKEKFAKDNRKHSGRSTICKCCDNARQRLKYKRAIE